MDRVLFITPGPIAWASSRLRAHWVAEHIPGAQVVEYESIVRSGEISPDFDVYIFVKAKNYGYVKTLLDAGKRVYWDICDPVHWFDPDESRKMADIVTGIVASNQRLAADFSDWYENRIVTTIKDRIKIEHYAKQKQHGQADPLRLIWYGAGQNRHAIFSAMAYLERLTANGVSISLTIMDDTPEDSWSFSKFPIYHVKWDLKNENTIIADHDLAILPEYPGPWGMIKSNNRSLTAYACGIPATTGANWPSLYKLATLPTYREMLVQRGRDDVLANYDVRQSAQEWIEHLENQS